jgi:hypothetical protein
MPRHLMDGSAVRSSMCRRTWTRPSPPSASWSLGRNRAGVVNTAAKHQQDRRDDWRASSWSKRVHASCSLFHYWKVRSTYAPCTCGNQILIRGEQCIRYGKNYLDCRCVQHELQLSYDSPLRVGTCMEERLHPTATFPPMAVRRSSRRSLSSEPCKEFICKASGTFAGVLL